MHNGIKILSRVIEEKATNSEEFNWLNSFSLGLKLLDDYDREALDIIGKHSKAAKYPLITEYRDLVKKMSG